MPNKDEQVGQLAKRYSDNQALLAKLESNKKAITKQLKALVDTLEHGYGAISCPDAETLKLGYPKTTIRVTLLATLHKTLNSLEKAKEEEAELKLSLEELGLDYLTKTRPYF